jgi:hypothetical protein
MLVESEMHILLEQTDPETPVWTQHRMQLQKLLRTPKGRDPILKDKIHRRFVPCLEWMQGVGVTPKNLEDLRDDYLARLRGESPRQPEGVRRGSL